MPKQNDAPIPDHPDVVREHCVDCDDADATVGRLRTLGVDVVDHDRCHGAWVAVRCTTRFKDALIKNGTIR